MNDFTKEELKIILLDMDTYVEWTSSLRESDSHRELRDKIQSMIDNYCEHHNDEKFNALPELGGIKMCKKCQGFYV